MSGQLCSGAESIVYRGTWRGQPVAIKKVRIATSADLDRFKSELAILSSLSHPAIVPLLAARCLPPDYLFVMPLAPGGNLRRRLHEAGWRPSWRQLLAIAGQIASGMEHVHAAGVLHRDIKPANILLAEAQSDPRVGADGAAGAEEISVQIADFGLAAREVEGGYAGGYDAASAASNGKPTGGFYKRQMVGTLEYMAPELLLRTAPPSRASDVYAFAVVVNEMATGTVPFSDCTKDNPEVHTVLEMGYGRQELAAAVCAEGLRPLLPKPCPPALAALLRACWQADPRARPGFESVRRELERMAAEELPGWEAEEAGRQRPAAGEAAEADAMAVDGAATVGVSAEAVAANGHSASHVDASAEGHTQHPMWPFVLVPDEEGGAAAVAAAGTPASSGAAGQPPVFNAGAFEAIGPRDSMEDRHIIMPDLMAAGRDHAAASADAGGVPSTSGACCGPAVSLAAVLDGHRGSEAADFCQARLPGLLREELAAGASPAEALRRAFARTETEYHAHWAAARRRDASLSRGPHAFPGCTALAALLCADGSLTVANAGDCRAVLVRGAAALAASRDHTAALAEERARLAAAGVGVTWQHGGWRLAGGTGLQVTRCLGDFDVKAGRPAPSPAAGVTAAPEVTALRLGAEDHLLILASDGLWDVMSPAEAAGLVGDTVKDPVMAAKRLVCEALMRGSADNVTALVAFLQPVATLERVYCRAAGQAAPLTGTAYGSRVRLEQDRARAVGVADEMRDTY